MQFDVIVIGAGPGGYVAAIRAAQLGFKTACIEKYPTLGGTCLNVGCIPSKALLHSSELYHQTQHELTGHGIELKGVELNLGRMMARKTEVVANLTKGVSFLLKKNKIEEIHGAARLMGQGKVEVKSDKNTQTLSAKHIILATGSKPVELPFLKYDKKDIVSSTGGLSFEKTPKHLLVIGGGVIGLELGSVWLRLGAEVTVVEFLDRILPPMDRAISKEMKRILSRQGMKFHLETKVTGAKKRKNGFLIEAEGPKAKKLTFEADKVLVAVGRRPYTHGLGLENTSVVVDKKGFVEIDDHFQTAEKGVYAIGDVVRGPMLAHKAEEEGVALAERLATGAGHVNYEVIPNVVYTWPEVASIGKNEDELDGVPYRTGQFPFKANSRARCIGDDPGFVKILAHEETDRILGVHIVGPNASELIQEAVVAMEFSASAEDLARTVHGHPTLSEAVKEAALAVDKRQIHG